MASDLHDSSSTKSSGISWPSNTDDDGESSVYSCCDDSFSRSDKDDLFEFSPAGVFTGYLGSLRRRMPSTLATTDRNSDDGDYNSDEDRRRSPVRIEISGLGSLPFHFASHSKTSRLGRFSTIILAFSIILWCSVQFLSTEGEKQYHPPPPKPKKKLFKEWKAEQETRLNERKKRPRQATHGDESGILSDIISGFKDLIKVPFSDKPRKEGDLDPGCVRAPWHSYMFVNCNEIHEVDLRDFFRTKANHTKGNIQTGFIGSGLWRDVWLVDPHFDPLENEHAYVMKVMKDEHKVTQRNFDRHRRDAMVMERLTAHPNVVDVFGYCGNTVLTEFVGTGLHDTLEMDDYETDATQKYSIVERLRMARDVAKGVAALHEIQGGPIVHADITAKQFLLTNDGIVKINDFNRCRFMAHDSATGKPCSFWIPTSPGRNRSPEEYEDRDLTEKMDVYSLANVLYMLLTGVRPWDSVSSKTVKNKVKDGEKPFIDEKLKLAGSPESVLARLVENSYEHDPRKRKAAAEIVKELDKALASFGQ